jgi:antitoxin component of MazEF toxin-antitoxin module
MSRRKIIASGEEAALLLSQETLKQMGVQVGDEVDVIIEDGALIVRPLDEAMRAQKIEQITDDLFEQRKSAYQRLAGGVE